ncbi:MAG TPA: hypothetical protein V6D48_18340 [Oculatellaceae cyanobacterium]
MDSVWEFKVMSLKLRSPTVQALLIAFIMGTWKLWGRSTPRWYSLSQRYAKNLALDCGTIYSSTHTCCWMFSSI